MGYTKWTYELVKSEFKKYNCVLLTLPEEYINSDSLLKYICHCGSLAQKTFSRFNSGRHNCPECVKKNKEEHRIKSYNYYKNLVEKDGSILLSKTYDGCKTPLLIRCGCGNVLEIGTRSKYFKCTECKMKEVGINKIKSTEQFIEEVYDLVKEEYTVISNYINAKENVKMRHNKCGNVFNVSPNNFLSKNSGCPKCKESKGEKRISNFLKSNNIYITSQYKFKDCKDKKRLPFDFALFKDEEKTRLNFIIEYDGELHYKTYNLENQDEALRKLKTIQHHDKLKNDYCNKNNIKLLRIPYWDFNKIEEILEKELKLKKEVI